MKLGSSKKLVRPTSLRKVAPLKGLAADLKWRRVNWGLSQQQLSERAKTTQRTIALIEAGQANPTVKLLLRLAKALDLDLRVHFVSKSRRRSDT